MNIFSLLRRLSSFQIIVLSFALLIGSGTLLLMTPGATQDGQGAALLPASSVQRSRALPPSETPTTISGACAVCVARNRRNTQPISSKSPEW